MRIVHQTARLCLAVGSILLLASCRMFSNHEISVSPATSSEKQAYFRNDLINPDGLRFDSTNFLRGNLLEKDFAKNPQKALSSLNTYYNLSQNHKYYVIAADLSHYLAKKCDRDQAVRCHLSALYYCCRAADSLSKVNPRSRTRSFVPFQMMQIFNESCSGIFQYLKKCDLLDHDAFHLLDLEGHKFYFNKPVYNLSCPRSRITDFSLCSNYTVHSLMQINRQGGIGVPLVARTTSEQHYQSLRVPEGLTIPVTMLIRGDWEPNGTDLRLTMIYQDTTLQEHFTATQKEAMQGQWPLALDFSTPLACFLNSLPERNLISVMVNPLQEEKTAGLYMLEPYNPNKIPVVFIHGLMSGPGTWIQMINTLKHDPVIRERYQFWFYYYSSGSPILYSAAKLHKALLTAQKELCTTPEASANFNRMLLVGHSMGGLITRTMLQKNPYHFVEFHAKMKWPELKSKLTDKELKAIEQVIITPLPFVHRAVFMAVPHRGSKLAHMSIAHFGSWITRLPSKLLQHTTVIKSIIHRLGRDGEFTEKFRNEFFTGIDNLAPDSPFIRGISTSPLKDDLIYHCVIGNQGGDDIPGGSDGVVPYTSSHLDGAASELVVKSGHSVHRTPRAMQELLRILRLHLNELK